MNMAKTPAASFAIPSGAEACWDDARASMTRLEAAHPGLSRAWFAGAMALALSIVLLIGAAVEGGFALARFHASFGWTERTQTVLREVAAVRDGLLEAGSALRSYVITSEPAYVDDYYRARGVMDGHVRAVAALAAYDPAERRQALDLQSRIFGREAAFDRAGGLTKPRRREIASALRDPARQDAMRDFSQAVGVLLDSFAAAEARLLAERRRAAEADETRTFWLTGIAAAAALASGILGMLLIQRERGARRAGGLMLKLMHAQRLVMTNATSMALAHELNQPLGAAGNYVAAVKRRAELLGTETSLQIAGIAQKALQQIGRASQIVIRLRRFIDKRAAARTIETPEQLVADAVALLGTLDTAIALEVRVAPGLPCVAVDRIQIQQVLVNLLRNAMEAMQAAPRQSLLLEVLAAPPGGVEFCLRDSGPGLDSDAAAHLFEPFNTSKVDGLGVGLSICRVIVAGHGGRIWAESTPGAGTTFHFTLPVAGAETELDRVA
jgi:two-component system sensor kinase FixL